MLNGIPSASVIIGMIIPSIIVTPLSILVSLLLISIGSLLYFKIHK